MDTSAMKPIAVLFILTFGFFFLGQAFWTHGIYMDVPLFGSRELDQIWSSHAFTLSSIFGLIASVKLYKASR
jgi:hypothetical protein